MLAEMGESLRRLARRPGGAILAALTLGLGLAVALTMFTVVDSVLLRPFPFADQERLLTFWASDPQRDVPRLEIMWMELERFREESQSLSEFAAYSAANNSLVLRRRGEPVQLKVNIVSREFLPMLGVSAHRGRNFTAAEHEIGAPAVCMISHAAWVMLFGQDEKILEEPLLAGEEPVEVVGVLPPHLDLPDDAQILFPLESSMPSEDSRNARVLAGLAKLRPDATIEQARAELTTIAARIERDHPDSHQGITVAVFPLVDELLGATRPALHWLLAMGVALLVIAFSNVANVFLTRAVGRGRELSLRLALGATRWRLLRQVSIEALVVTLVAAGAGLLLARVGLSLLLRWAPENLPRLGEIGVRGSTYFLLVAISLVVCLALSWFSTWRPAQSDLTHSIGAGSRASLARGARALLDGVVVVQVALTLLLLAAASIFLQGYLASARIDPGFRTENVITAHLPRGYVFGPPPQQAQRRLYFDALLERVRALPGVQAAGSVLMRPLEMEQGWDFAHTVQGQGPAEQEQNPLANLLSATPGYFEAMGIRLVAGRTFSGADTAESEKVVVVGESFARRLGGTESAIGRQIKSGKPDSASPWLKVVGVVGDVRYRALATEKLDLYVPYTQTNWSPNYLAVRVDGEPAAAIAALRAIARELDPEAPLSSVRTTSELVGAKLAQPRLNAAILVLFAATAIFLAFVGLYSLLSYVTSLRAHELGVRVCLGATAARLRRMVIRESLRIALPGVLVGAVASLALARLMASQAFGIGAVDARLLAAAGVALTAVCVMAALGPALRATRVDPAAVMRGES
jgi:putative ABC transport system permease protein